MRGIIKEYPGLDFSFNDMIKSLRKEIVDESNKPRYVKKTSFAPSKLAFGNGACERYWWFAYTGTEFVDTFKAEEMSRMNAGTASHERLEPKIQALYDNVELEVEVKNSEPPIRGFVDFVIKLDNHQEIIGEIKTTSRANVAKVVNSGKPLPYHAFQVMLYMYLLKQEYGVVLYESTGDYNLHVTPLYMTDEKKEYFDDLMEWLTGVHKYATERDTPPPPRFTQKSYECGKCPVFKQCWQGDYGIGKPVPQMPKFKL